jgi:hypothetical protein
VIKKPVSVDTLLSIFAQTERFRPPSLRDARGLEAISDRQHALVGDRLRVSTLRELPAIALALLESVRANNVDEVLAVAHQSRATLLMCGFVELSVALERHAIPNGVRALEEWVAAVIAQIDQILIDDLLRYSREFAAKQKAAEGDSGDDVTCAN